MLTEKWVETARETEPASFRDPDGFIYYRNNKVFRQINLSYKDQYDHLISSGLYKSLVDSSLLIPHEEINEPLEEGAYKLISPEKTPFISYPYEWCFSQLKDAALLTLKIVKAALSHGMILKDSSAYNVQFWKAKPIFIDTLSFDFYQEGQAWVAYKQFCQHFIAPLLLMSRKDPALSGLLLSHIDGIPLELASKLLPASTKLNLHILSHVHLHAKSIRHHSGKNRKVNEKKISLSIMGIIDSLESLVKNSSLKQKKTEWGNYYDECLYNDVSLQDKKNIVGNFLDECGNGVVWDIGANDGFFSRISGNRNMLTVSLDFDHQAVEKNYHYCCKNKEENILPLISDISTPTPAIGWANKERKSLAERGPANTLMALAVIHHIVISKGVPLQNVAAFFKNLCSNLIIEFVPKSDPQVQKLLLNRKDIFDDYIQEKFESLFSHYFHIEKKVKIKDSERIMYLMKVK